MWIFKRKGAFGYCSTIVRTCYVFSQKIAPGIIIFFAFENISELHDPGENNQREKESSPLQQKGTIWNPFTYGTT